MHQLLVRLRRGTDRPQARSGRQWLATLMAASFVATVAASAMTVTLPAVEVHAAVAKPRAVIIVGPSASSTADFLKEGELFADQAQAAGMSVTRIFHPRATWARVRPAVQGANLVVYFGHGNGWPSAYAPFQENTKNGFGLNGYEGAPAGSHVYYGGNVIRDQVRLADDAVVILYRSCYSAGNGEDDQPVPSKSVAIDRVDNFAAAFLHRDVGAGVVMAYRTKQWVDFAAQLMRPRRSMDDVFKTRSAQPGWRMSGWMGTNDFYVDSDRTKGARLHLDQHASAGYSRAITGDLGLTTDEWRGADPSSATDELTEELRIKTSDETPGRGQTVTFRVVSTQPLTSSPTLRIKQPGLTAYTVSTSWIRLERYTTTVRLASGGTAGTLQLTALADPVGGEQAEVLLELPLH